jgi:bifunctional N-acetylglucosamine-1-phosphate-uridyltransferase/glucosamine-1-phosphate-acetyltransferase GlmU-like protein
VSGRVLVIPAAGRGSRLGSDGPKVLAPVAGRPMLDWLLDLYLDRVETMTLVVQPAARDSVAQALRSRAPHAQVAVQETPTGMLDAVGIGIEGTALRAGARVWVTWCDQIAVLPATLDRLQREEAATALCFPTILQSPPYIHFERDPDRRIVGVAQRRDGDPMPATGESDVGLFSLSAEAARDRLRVFSAAAPASPNTGERNFLPFIPWLAATEVVRTFPASHPIEAVGVNTPGDRVQVEAFLAGR